MKKIFKSIRWRLQLWYGLILVVVLAGFGFTAYQLERGRQFRHIDDELMRRVGVIGNALRPPPRRPEPGRPPFDRQPPGQFPGNGPPGPDPRPPVEFHLPPQAAGLFDDSDTNGFYYIIRTPDGMELSRSANAPQYVVYFSESGPYATAGAPAQSRRNPSGPEPPRMHGTLREIFIITPRGETILVGRNIVPELKELRLVALKLVGVGGVILLLGLTGGWWIATRAIRPIEDISATAVKISAGDMSQRINIADTESELGQLAGVLNSTFGRLEAAFARQQQFTSDAAHELRTPVSVMLTQTQTALNRERSPAEYRETVDACQRAAQRMRRMIESLLELARLDAGQEEMKRMRFDLSQTARDCVDLIRPLAGERGVKIHCELPLLECVGDPDRIAQVIANLLTNAIQYNKENGEVRVTAEQRDGGAILTVSDTGQGIAAEDLPHIFERFFRTDKSRSGASGHAGLGLAIAKAIVEAHSGAIEVSSQPETGSTFTVRLPA